MGSLEEKSRFESLNRRFSKLFDSPRHSTVSSSSSNDRMSIATSVSTDLSDSDRPVSLVSTASSDSLQSSHYPHENVSTRASMAQPLHNYFQNGKTEQHPEAHEALQKDSHCVETAALSKVNQIHNNNNNSVNRRGLRGSVSLSPFASKVATITHKLSYVERVVVEIVETERMYVRDLRSIVEDYLGEIIDTHELPIRPEQVSDLFGNIEDIYALNSELLQDLDSCDNDPVAVARCFVEKSQYFDVYTQYCTNYPNSVAALTECMRSKLLAKFFRERQEMLKHSLPLGSYLLKPVQRILKYHLLLQEIAKHFDMEEEGYEVVEEAIDTMTGVAWYINDMKRKHEHAVRLQEIQSLLLNWKGSDLTTYGELVLEGTFRIQRARNERTLFLFYKALFITKKRGDHFVYKTHIPCSSLMLIESTRESLYFSLTHYKNSKQLYNIQVRTAEEKRLWTHHIKKLILENYHAIIPQKAKEAILEMDALYPSRFKYSPERVKKAMSTDDPTVQSRQGRRLSEPSKHILKHLGDKVLLKHADSAGALLDIGDTFQPSVPSLVSSLGQSETTQEDLVNELSSKESPEHLNLSDSTGKDPGADLSASEEEEEEEEEEEMLMGDDQSKETGELELAKGFKRQKSRSDTPERPEIVDVLSADKAGDEFEPLFVQEEPHLEIQHPEEMLPDLTPTRPQEPTVMNQLEGIVSGRGADIHDPVGHTDTVEDLKAFSSEDEEEEGPMQEPQSILPPSVLDQASIIAERFLNSLSRRSSLAMDDGKFIGCLSPRLTSRSGSTMSLDCTDKPQFHTSSSELYNCFSPREVPIDTGVSSCFSPLNGTGSPSLESPFETERSMIKRKDSTLSKQDRLLLDKIKNYYDHAENHDEAFSIKRRESLSYIPTGLVRNSVFKFNSLPRSESKLEAPGRKRIKSASNSNDVGGSRPASWTQPDVHTSNDEIPSSVSHPKKNLDQARSDDLKDQLPITDDEFKSPSEMFKVWEEMEKVHSDNVTENHGTFNECAIEKTHITLGDKQNEDRFSENNENGYDLHEPLLILEDSDLSTITEESSAPSPETTSPSQAMPAKLSYDPAIHGQDFKMDQPIKLHPKILQLAQSIDGDMTEKMKNKVYQLARKYSQRIKCNKPVVQRRLRELEEDLRRNYLPSVQEEKQTDVKGKLKPALLLLPTYDHILIQEHSSLTPVSGTSSIEKSPKRFSFSPSCTSPGISLPSKSGCRSPLSPVTTEKFHWPDVRELRSKYTSKPGTVKSPPVNRSQSVPDNIADHYPADSLTIHNFEQREPIGRSYSMNIGQISNSTDQTARQVAQHSSIDTEGHRKLSAMPSVIPNLGGCTTGALQANRNRYRGTDGAYCVTAEAPLENNKKVIIMERLHHVDLPDRSEKEVPRMENDDSYVQIRSPTSREKISLKAVVERCKAYQESEEYRKREAIQAEETKEQTVTDLGSEQRGTSSQSLWDKSDQNQQSRVKNLRKKFQTLGSNS